MRPEDYITREGKFGAHNYHPLPVVLEKGEGVFVWELNAYYLSTVLRLTGLNRNMNKNSNTAVQAEEIRNNTGQSHLSPSRN